MKKTKKKFFFFSIFHLKLLVIQEKEEDSGSESEEEADGVDTGSLNSSNQISLLIHIPFLKKTETIKFSPYCTISETMKIIMEECSIDQENYQVSDFKVCKMGRSGMASGDNRVWLEPSLSLNSYRLKSGVFFFFFVTI